MKSQSTLKRIFTAALFGGAILWPSMALWPCEQTIAPGQSIKLSKNWRFRTGSNSPANRDPGQNDSGWERLDMPARFSDHPTTKKYQGYVWYRCTINLEERHFVREVIEAEPPPEVTEEEPAPSTAEGEEAGEAGEAGATTPAGGENPDAGQTEAARQPEAQPAVRPNPNGAAGEPSPPTAAPAQPVQPGAKAPAAEKPRRTIPTRGGPGFNDPDYGLLAQAPTQGADPLAPEGPPIRTPAEVDGEENPDGAAGDLEKEPEEEPLIQYGPPRLKGMGDLAVYLGNLGDADIAYFNGEQIGQTGVPDQEKPSFDVEKERLYSIPHHLWRPGKNVIAVLVLGTEQASGFARVPEIVPEQQRARQIYRSHTMAVVFSFLYILVAAFFGLFAIFFRDQKEHLFFSLFSLFLGVYNLFRTNMRYILFDNFTFETTYQIELIILMLLPMFFLNFLIHIIGLKNNRALHVYYGIYGVLILATLFARAPIYWSALINLNLLMMAIAIGVGFYLLYKHYNEARDRLRFVVYGMVPLAVAIVYDMVNTLLGLTWPRITVYTFLIFLGFVALQLSGSILQLFHRMREQEEDLIGLERRKTRSIFNISREFSVILEGIYNGLDHLENRSDMAGKPGARKSDRGKKPNIDRSMRNLENLVNDSRLISLLEQKDYAERNVNFSLRNLSQAVIDRALVATGENKRRLVLNLPEEEVQVSGDPDLLSTALYHLVENALYYSTGRIEVYAEREYTALKFTVRDEGPGMSPEQQRHIFQKFIRGSDDSEVPGIGIGLPIVNLIARQLSGELRLESGEGFFSTFIFQCPLPPDQRAA